MKKIFSIFIFFLIAFFIFYFFRNINVKNGITIDEINKIASSKINADEGRKILHNLKNIDLSSFDMQKQNNILKFIESQNLFENNKLEDFVNASKNIEGITKDLYYKILYSSYLKNPAEFIKTMSKFNAEEISDVFTAFSNKYIEKPKLVSDLQDIIKNGRLTEEQKARLNKTLEYIKSSIDR